MAWLKYTGLYILFEITLHHFNLYTIVLKGYSFLPVQFARLFDLLVVEFYGPVNNEVMSTQ